MPVDLREILSEHADDEYLQSFIDGSRTSDTANMNQTRVASEVLLTKTIRDQSHELSKTLIEQTEKLTSAISKHADALVKSGKAAERHAAGLKWATWALFLATLVLVAVAGIELWFRLTNGR